MNRFPPPIRDVPELVSSSPYFDLAELVIIPVWLQPDRTYFMQTLLECATDRLAIQLLRSSPNAPHNERGIVPTVHEIRPRFGSFVCITLHWRGITQVIALPSLITCKQQWLWLSYHVTHKIIHNSEHVPFEPLCRFHPIQLSFHLQ